MNTLTIIVLTVVAVHFANFLVLTLDELFRWKYEDYAKRFCCFSAFAIFFVLVIFPMSIKRKLDSRRQKRQKYIVRRFFKGDKWNPKVVADGVITTSVSYKQAFESIKNDIDLLRAKCPDGLSRFRREYDDIYMVGEYEGYAVRYEIEKE